MAKLEKLVEDLSSLTVLEAAELSKLLEEKWGVSAAAPVAVAAAPAAGGAGAAPAAADEEQTEFTVVLTSGGDKRINVIKEVRSVRADLGLKEAKDLVEGAPQTVKENVSKRKRKRSKRSSKPPARPSRSSSQRFFDPSGRVDAARPEHACQERQTGLSCAVRQKSRGALFSSPPRPTKYAFLSNQRHDSHARAWAMPGRQ